MSVQLLRDLFESRTVSVCAADAPFWQEGGKLSALELRCHGLFGDTATAASMEALVDTAKDCPVLLYPTIVSGCREAYEEIPVYRNVIDALVRTVSEDPAFSGITHVIGCEGTGLLLSALTAELLNKPHLTVLSDKSVYASHNGRTLPLQNLNGARALFITDFFTENSDFFKYWLPSVYALGSNKLLAVALVDRRIGGSDRLVGEGIYCHALFDADEAFFARAAQLQLITAEQAAFIRRYLRDPHRCIADLLEREPEFLKRSLQSHDPIIAQRAQQCVQRGLYQLSNTQR